MVMSVYFEDHSIEAYDGRRSLRSGAVVVCARVLITFIQLLTFLVLARLLSPEDYGLVGMVTAITVFAPLLVKSRTPVRRGSTRSHHRAGNQRTVLDQRSSRVQCCGFDGGIRATDRAVLW